MRTSVLWFLFLLPTASAASLVFDSYIQSGTNITVDWHNFIVTWTDKGILVNSDIRDFFITDKPCEKAFPYTVCMNNTPPSSPNGLLYITITKDKSLLEIQRRYSTTETDTGKYITVDVTLTNLGADELHHIDYRDAYPDALEIFGRTLPGNTFQETVEMLKAYGVVHFAYSLRAKEPVSYLATAYASYGVKGRKEEVYSPHTLLRINPAKFTEPFTLIASTERNRVELNRETVLHITVKNNLPDEIQFPYVQIQLPDQLTVRGNDFKKQGMNYVAKGAVQGFSERTFDSTIIPVKEGSYEIKISAGGNVHGMLKEENVGVYLNPGISPLQHEAFVQYNVSDNVLGLVVRLENTNEETAFDDVRIGLRSPSLQFDDVMYNSIKPGEKVDGYNTKIELDRALRNPLLRYTATYRVDNVFYKDEDFVYLGQPQQDVMEATGQPLQIRVNTPPELTIDAAGQDGQATEQGEATQAGPTPEHPSGNIVVVRAEQENSPWGSIKLFFERVVKRVLE